MEWDLLGFKQTNTFSACVWKFNIQQSVLSKLDELEKKIIFFNMLQTWIEQVLFRMPHLSKTCGDLFKFKEKIRNNESYNKKK